MVQPVEIIYFARLREERGLNRERIETNSQTFRELYEELRIRHGLSLSMSDLHLSVNNDFCDWDTPIQTQDTIVFIPPVSGG